ncbi:MAG: hypothetical protein ACREJV_14795 [Candidatus Rokuibacteriota bacterium]
MTQSHQCALAGTRSRTFAGRASPSFAGPTRGRSTATRRSPPQVWASARPPLQTPDDVKTYAHFMSQLYAEEYVDRDLASVTDRFCINDR